MRSMNRVAFLIDGFNLYHSVRDINDLPNAPCLKWLDVRSLCSSFLPIIGKGATLLKIYYFSALAHHLGDPEVLERHSDYIECLKSTGIEPVMGDFKRKKVKCSVCHREFWKHEEKATDVGIGAKLLEVLFYGDCETIVLITGDTDIIPAIKTAHRIFPDNEIIIAFPFKRKNDELASVVTRSFKIHINSYKNNQFPSRIMIVDGTIIRTINKPAAWV